MSIVRPLPTARPSVAMSDSSPVASVYRPQKVTVIGVGLLGGSIGLAIRHRWPDAEVIGVARRPDTRQEALAAGAVTVASDDLPSACADADLVIICTPVSKIARQAVLAAGASPPGALITDVGSTKAAIARGVDEDPLASSKFVPSHPIAGSEKSGPKHARADLLADRLVVVTPTDRTDPQRLADVGSFWQQLGARVTQLTPERHDEIFAAVSHVPHLVAAVLASIISGDALPMVGSGWRDTTRVAAGDPEMWTAICQQNAPAILGALEVFTGQLRRLTLAIEQQDASQIRELLARAKTIRDQLAP